MAGPDSQDQEMQGPAIADGADAKGPQSSFFKPSPVASVSALAMLQLTRDSLIPIVLHHGPDGEGYAEGAVTNTRFGSFPHSTLIGLPWGSQVRASKVDTGARGREDKKRKRQDAGLDDPDDKARRSVKAAVDAGSGFVHLLDPTPETWTMSLDHRTQVVYTPDYSYILPRIRVRPGSTLIEAGAGSGSFTHAAARALYTGQPGLGGNEKSKPGRICSYEYHEPRAQTLQKELDVHRLNDTVTLTHRDVCSDGFMLPDGTSPMANSIFLDLPAPWQALRHLNRSTPSALDPNTTTHLCSFSPCIEQVTATVSFLRKNGWTEIEMVEVQNKRIDVRRDQIGLRHEGLRGVNSSAANVQEAVSRLREVESRFHEFKKIKTGETSNGGDGQAPSRPESKQARLERIKKEAAGRKIHLEGNLIHRTESEIRTHTSYLVFAMLPRGWSQSDEEACLAKWPIDKPAVQAVGQAAS